MSDEIDITDLMLTDDDIRRMDEAFKLRLLRIKHPYTFDLIRVLARYNSLSRILVLHSLRKSRERAGLPVPPSFDSVVQASLQYYCVDSDVFRARNAPATDGLFSWPRGKGAGEWALCREVARLWIRSHRP